MPARRSSGFTLIELIVFIVVIGVALAGVLTVFNTTVRGSVDPAIHKQMLAVAESLLEEVEAMPFTYCDPNDPNASTATSAVLDATNTDGTKCVSALEVLGPDVGETRSGPSNFFNNVNDYYVFGGMVLNPVTDINGSHTYNGFSATIQIVPEALNNIASAACASATDCTAMEALRVAVTVSHGAESLTLEGYRVRHSPQFTP